MKIINCNDEAENYFFVPGYQRVEYIQSYGSQYINTGLRPNTNYKFYAKIAPYKAGNNRDRTNPFFCFRTSSGGNEFAIRCSPTNDMGHSTITFNYNGTAGVGQIDNLTKYTEGTIVEFESYFTGYKYMGTAHTWSTPTTGGPNAELKLFTLNAGGSIDSRKFYGKTYAFKVWENNTLIRDFVPCYRKSDNVIGLIDKVNKVFYTNNGSGSFTKGPDA